MSMVTVKQPTWAPTNKLTASILAGVAYEFLQPVIARGVEWAGSLMGIAWELGPNGDMLLQFSVMSIVGYLVKDRPNV